MEALDYYDILELHKKAKQAVELCPDCIVAYEAFFKTNEHKKVRDRYIQLGVEVGRKRFDADFFEKNKGQYWLMHETRPFMRLLAAEAERFIEYKKSKEAISIYEEMLIMDPRDAAGIRLPLQVLYLEAREFDLFIDLLDAFEDDQTPHSYFNYALYLYMVEGPSEDADEAMEEAVSFNPYVLPYLMGKKINEEQISTRFFPKGEDGAILYILDARKLWFQQKGIQNWLRQFERWY
jgi:tetratricopeptide (TPR) repeat protein